MAIAVTIMSLALKGPRKEDQRHYFDTILEETAGDEGYYEIQWVIAGIHEGSTWGGPWYEGYIYAHSRVPRTSPTWIPEDKDEYTVTVNVRDRDTQTVLDSKIYTFNIEYLRTEEEIIPVVEEPVPTVLPIPTVAEPPAISTADLPWYIEWARPIYDVFNGFAQWVGSSIQQGFTIFAERIDPINQQLKDLSGAINPIHLDFPKIGGWVWDGLYDRITAFSQRFVKESIDRTLETIPEVTGETPEWKTELDGKLTPFAEKYLKTYEDLMNPETHKESPMSPEEAAKLAQGIGTGAVGVGLAVWLAHAAAEAASLGQYEAVKGFDDMVIAKLGLGALGAKALSIPLERGAWIGAEQFYNSIFLPEIPATTDLIEMVVKEVITLDEFKKWMKYKGLNETWSQNIWDKHFIPPNLNDLLTSWRRGHITDEDLDRLEILVDLDPRFKNIWNDRRYIDPTRTEARFGYELGALDADGVRDVIKRGGYFPEDIDWVVDYITKFPTRRWKWRRLTALISGYMAGVVDDVELDSQVAEVYPQNPEIAEEMKAIADIRRRIKEAVKKPEVAAVSLPNLSNGQLLAGFKAGCFDDTRLRELLLERGFTDEEIEILICIKGGVPS